VNDNELENLMKTIELEEMPDDIKGKVLAPAMRAWEKEEKKFNLRYLYIWAAAAAIFLALNLGLRMQLNELKEKATQTARPQMPDDGKSLKAGKGLGFPFNLELEEEDDHERK